MQKFSNVFLSFRLSSSFKVFLLLFGVSFFLFGVLLSHLGFFQDDWHHVYYAYHEGVSGLKNFFYTDSRPLAYGLYSFLFQVLGFSPAPWHWLLMTLRFLTALAFWGTLRLFWPNQQALTAWLGVFFVLQPVYTLQPLAVAYTLHWVAYLAVMASFALMLLSRRARGTKMWLYAVLALLLQAYHLVMMEYFAGLEIARIVLLWFSQTDVPLQQRLRRTLRAWLPYLVILVLYAVYRLSYDKIFGYDRFAPALLTALTNQPLAALFSLLQTVIRDLVYVVVSPWYKAIEPSALDLTRPSTWYLWGVSLVLGVLSVWVISRLADEQTNTPHHELLPLALTGLGLLMVVVALIPSWLVGFEIAEKNPLWSSRLALPALPGLSFLICGLGYFFVQSVRRRMLLFGVLVAIAAASHIQTARSFHESWEKQRQFYWQMHWRAPALQPGTLVVADNEILFYMGDSPTAYALNLLYPKTTQPPAVDYWFNPGSANLNWVVFEQGQPVEMRKYSSVFWAASERVLAITFEPSQGQCLWLLRPAYREIRFLSEEAYRWMAFSDIHRVQLAQAMPPSDIFGPEPPHTWCYHYQKADLAAQLGDWPQVIRLWQAASASGLRPAASVELLPFIEAYARTAQSEKARELVEWANTLPPRMPDLLCTTWKTYKQEGLLSEALFQEVAEDLNCQE
ncbi:MAG: hypothetical protein DDG60_13425 [Anaerolineae bacterium]|nr:MAG: hypothetical protein DDG60_13425 [Anaerolineae bacterium]